MFYSLFGLVSTFLPNAVTTVVIAYGGCLVLGGKVCGVGGGGGAGCLVLGGKMCVCVCGGVGGGTVWACAADKGFLCYYLRVPRL